MSGLIKSTAILAFARVTNFALLLLSPILLVRLLDTHTFGQYREFMVYAMLVSMLAAFSVKSNLLYFIPKSPERSRGFVANSLWIVFGTSSLACVILFLFRDAIFANTSFNFLIPLILYVLLFTNFDILESYWLARKQPNNVFYYSVVRTFIRLAAILGAALYSPAIGSLLTALIAVEAIRIVAVVVIMVCIGLKPAFIDASAIRDQLTFIVPLGLAGGLHYLNQYIGQIAISTHLGVVALAIYTIGNYQIPILNIVRGSINDSIFPDMVREALGKESDSLRLWKRSNIAYTSVIVPVLVLLFFYADVLIPIAFTRQYAGAVPIFRILVAVILIQCFEFSSPLRAANRNKLLLAGNVVMLGTNVGLILFLFNVLGASAIYGPAIAIVLAYVIQHIFMGLAILKVYSVPFSEFMKWASLRTIFLSAGVSALALIAGEFSSLSDIIRMLVFSTLFSASYYLLIRRARLDEVEILMRTLSRRWQQAWQRISL